MSEDEDMHGRGEEEPQHGREVEAQEEQESGAEDGGVGGGGPGVTVAGVRRTLDALHKEGEEMRKKAGRVSSRASFLRYT